MNPHGAKSLKDAKPSPMYSANRSRRLIKVTTAEGLKVLILEQPSLVHFHMLFHSFHSFQITESTP